MCTYITERAGMTGSGKGPDGWFALAAATVSYDHPVHAQAEHSLNVDFANPSRGPAARVAVELTTESALDLIRAIGRVLSQVPGDLSGVDPARAQDLVFAAERLRHATYVP